MATRVGYVGTQSVGDILTSASFSKLPGGWLGYVETTSAQTGITTVTDLTGLSVAVTVGTSRRIRVSAQGTIARTVTDGLTLGRIQEGASALGVWFYSQEATEHGCGSVVLTPTAGTHTYKCTLERQSGTGTVGTAPAVGNPCWLLVEDVGPVS